LYFTWNIFNYFLIVSLPELVEGFINLNPQLRSVNNKLSNLNSQIESILFAASRPVKISELTKSLDKKKPEIQTAIDELKATLFHRGIVLLEKDDKVQLVTNPENAKAIGNFMVAEQREKLTDAAIETLAIIAYKQPISRAEIEAIRGVNSQYILRQLSIRGLVEKNSSPDDARRLVYKTTLEFMTHLGLRDMKTLPDFEEVTKNVQLPEQEPGEEKTNEQLSTEETPQEKIPSEEPRAKEVTQEKNPLKNFEQHPQKNSEKNVTQE